MMRKLVFLPLLLTTILHAQFAIEGELKNYASKPILLKVYENGSPELVKRITTDTNGKFTYQHPTAYTGKMIFELSKGSFEAIAANQPIKFSLDVNDVEHKIQFYDSTNLQVQNNFDLVDKKALRDYTLVELLKIYQPDDEFYTHIQNEIDRIDKLSAVEIPNENVQYYVDAKNDLGLYNSNKLEKSEVKIGAKQHLVRDNINLERFGLLQEFLSIYISYSVYEASSMEGASSRIEEALDELLEEVQVDTSRGQAILTNIIPMLEGNGFTTLSNKYLGQADALTCEISPELKELIESRNNIEVGQIVPNIKFDNAEGKVTSLYDVKADKKLLVFWASWCPHCMRELPKLKAYYDEFVAQGGEIIAISLDLDEDAYQQAIQDTRWINYSDLQKWDSPLVGQFGITSTPTMILLDKDNKVVQVGNSISQFK